MLHHFILFHFIIIHNRCSTTVLVTHLVPSGSTRFGHRTCKTGTFRRSRTERARLDTLQDFGTERPRPDTFRGFSIARARLCALKENIRNMCFYSKRAKANPKSEDLHEKLKIVLPAVILKFVFLTHNFTKFLNLYENFLHFITRNIS